MCLQMPSSFYVAYVDFLMDKRFRYKILRARGARAASISTWRGSRSHPLFKWGSFNFLINRIMRREFDPVVEVVAIGIM